MKTIFFAIGFLATLLPAHRATAQDRIAGKKMYLTFCSSCHGESGRGDGPATPSLSVKPADHTDGNVMNQHSDQFLFDIISKGGAGVKKSSLMPAWSGQLNENQIGDLIAYVRSLAVPAYKPSKR